MNRTAGRSPAGHVWPVTALRISVMLDVLHSGRVVARITWSARSTSASLTRFAGRALGKGFAAADGDIIVALDTDGDADGGDVLKFVYALKNGADFAKGSRFTKGARCADRSRLARCIYWVLSTAVNLAFGTHYTDLRYGPTAFWRKHLSELQAGDGGDLDSLMGIRAAKLRLDIQEIPSRETQGHICRTRYIRRTLKHAKMLLGRIFRERIGVKR
jgi:glycosyltransferase involved in cell wall biosynthesis